MLTRLSFGVALALISSSALAGTVTFEPPHVEVVAGETVSMTVTVDQTDLAEFDSVSLLIVGPVEWPDIGFEYDPVLLKRVTSPPIPPPGCKWFCYGIYIGAVDFAAPLFAAPLLVGTVTVDTSSLTAGTYDIVVSASAEEKLFGFALSVAAAGLTQEGLEGRATFTIVPEPSSLMLLIPLLAAATIRWCSSIVAA